MSGYLLIFGVLLIVGGLIQFFARDWLWQRQVNANKNNGIPWSKRTIEWDKARSNVGMLGLGVGALFVVTGVMLRPANLPAGVYGCLPNQSEPDVTLSHILTINDDGSATYDDIALAWTYDKMKARVTFSGDTRIVYGEFIKKNDPLNFVVMFDDGEKQLCLHR